MNTIDIYRSASVILSPAIDGGTTLFKSLNGEDYVTVSFSLDSYTDILIGDYINFRSSLYTVRQAPDVKKISYNEYRYSIRFDGSVNFLLDAIYLLDGDMEFYFTGTAEDFVDLIVENLNRVHGTGSYETGSVDSTDYKALHFNGENCLQALQRVCREFELEYALSGTSTISISLEETIGNSTGLVYGYKNGLYNIKRTKVNNKNVITRLYPYGSEKNLGPDYVDGQTRTPLGIKLRLDPSSYPNNYIEQNVAIYGLREATKEFPDVYPHYTGTVDSTSDSQHIVDSSIDFDLNSYLIEGMAAKIVFLSGDLSGYEFEIISFNNVTKEVYFKQYTDEQGNQWPTSTINPAVGDRFTFVDISMPEAYIDAAEAELLSKATDYLNDVSSPSLVYEIEMDWHSLKEDETELDVGDVISVIDSDLATDSVDLRIVELTQQLDNAYKYKVKISDDKLVNYIARSVQIREDIKDSVKEVTYRGIRRTPGDLVRKNRDDLDFEDGATVGADFNSNLLNKPTALADINASEGSKLTTVEEGATAGADFNVNLANKPVALADINASEGSKLSSVEENATAGADYLVNVANKPAALADINSSEGSKLSGIEENATNSHTYAQAVAPASGMQEGDFWIDTDDSNKLYRYNGSSWVSVRDAGIQAALDEASSAQDTADGKIESFYQAGEPAGGTVGDLWFDTDDSNKVYRHNGSSWVAVRDEGISQAISDASTAQATADGKVTTFFTTSTPTAEGVGDLWYSSTTKILKRWSGSAWVDVSVFGAAEETKLNEIEEGATNTHTFFQAGTPTGMREGDFWIDSDDSNKLYRYNGTSWVNVRDQGIQNALDAASTAQSTADGKIESFYQTSAPAGGSLGDLWFDTDDGNKAYRHHGNGWVAVQDAGISQALSDASDAQATADGKVTTFFGTSTPTAEGVGDLWYNGSTKIMKRWSGSSWVDVSVFGATEESKLNGIESGATNSHTYAQASAPTGMREGDFWIDTDNDNILYRYNGTSWVNVRDAGVSAALTAASNAQSTADGKIESFYQSTAPSVGSIGDLWFDTDDGNKAYRHNGTSWVAVQDGGIAQALDDASTAQATADGKVITFFGTTSPTAEATGDLWYKSDTKILYRWSGSSWVAVSVFGATHEAKLNGIAENADRTETEINGGIVTSGRIELGSSSTINAGINGSGTSSSDIRIWAGATYANRAGAPFRVNQAGEVTASNATLQTSATGQRVVISASDNIMQMYDSSNVKLFEVEIDNSGGKFGSGTNDGSYVYVRGLHWGLAQAVETYYYAGGISNYQGTSPGTDPSMVMQWIDGELDIGLDTDLDGDLIVRDNLSVNGNAQIDNHLQVGEGSYGDDGEVLIYHSHNGSISGGYSGYGLCVNSNEYNGYAASFFNDGNSVTRKGIVIKCGMDDQSGSSSNNYITFVDGDGGLEGYMRVSNGTLAIAQASDERLKKNIEDWKDDALFLLSSLPLRTFNWEKDKESTNQMVGYIAQEVVGKVKNFVYEPETDEDIYTINPSALIPYLHKAILELQEQINQLKN